MHDLSTAVVSRPPNNSAKPEDRRRPVGVKGSRTFKPYTDRREAGRDAFLAQIEAGRPISGAELGRRFGMSATWGQERAAEVRASIAQQDFAASNKGFYGEGGEFAETPTAVEPASVSRVRRWFQSVIASV